MELMGYDALNLGEGEFRFGRAFLDEQREKAGFPFLSANLVERHSGEHPYEAYVIKQAGHLKVGIIGLVSPDLYQGSELVAQDPVSTLKGILPRVKEEVHFIVLLAHTSYAEAIELAGEVEGINVIVVAHEGKLATRPAEVGDTLIVQGGARGMYVGYLRITADTDGHIIGYHGETGVLDEQVGSDFRTMELIARHGER